MVVKLVFEYNMDTWTILQPCNFNFKQSCIPSIGNKVFGNNYIFDRLSYNVHRESFATGILVLHLQRLRNMEREMTISEFEYGMLAT